MSTHAHHRTINPALLILFGIFAWFAESASDNLVLKRLYDFTLDEEDKDYSASNWQLWFWFSFAALGSLPYILTMLFHWKYSKHHHHDHHHSRSQVAAEVGVMLGSFGLLGAAGAFLLLEKIIPSDQLALEITKYGLSGAAGAFIGFGNYKFHSTHLHAKENLLTLLKKLPPSRKFAGVLLAVSVLIGHLFQGALDGAEFTDVIDKNAPMYGKLIPTITLGVVVTFFEGYSEMRSALMYFNNDQEYKKILTTTKILLTFPAMLHAALPVEGSIRIVSMIYKLWTGHSLAHTLELPWRIALVAGSSIAFGIENGYTFYTMNLSTFNIAVENGLEYVVVCWANFLVKPKLNAGMPNEEKRSLLSADEEIPEDARSLDSVV